MNKTKIDVTYRSWRIESEIDDDRVDTHIESPCGNFGGSISMAEDLGAVCNYSDDGATEKKVPESVLDKAQEIDESMCKKLDEK